MQSKNSVKIVLCIFLLMVLVQGVQAAGTPVDFSANKTPGTATAIADTSANYRSPWVTNTNTTSATINWRGESSGSGSIDYATSIYYAQHQSFDKRITSSEIASYQHLEITGLTPNTSYTYRVRPTGNESAFGNRTFRTMPVSGPFTFIVISDSQEGHYYTEWMRFKYVADAVANETDVLFILHGGDYAGHDSLDLWDTYFQVADGMLAKSAIFSNIGNHEYHNGSDSPPSLAVQYHTSYNKPLNYSFDCADVRFVVLNSPDPNNANGDDPHTSLALATSQESWLRQQLDNNLSGTFTIHHHPIWDYYNTTSNPDLQPWETLYHTFNISATFAGHTHNYQRYSVMGIPYFIIGNAGGMCADLNASDSYPVWYQLGETRQLGYLKVFVDPANNTATAQEIFVASVQEDDSNETPVAYNPPFIKETFTFPLKVNPSPEPSVSASAGVFRSGAFYLKNSNSAGNADNSFAFGAAGDTPIVGDWTGQGKDTAGVFRQGVFYLRNSNSAGNADNSFTYGAAGDKPLVGHWTTGQTGDSVGVFRSGTFYLKNTNSAGNADNTFTYGAATDTPIVGDWTGKGYDTVGVFRQGVFYLKDSNSAGNADNSFAFGAAGDIPVIWHHDGKDTVGVFRSGTFYLRNTNSAGNADNVFIYGAATDTPLEGKWI